MKKRRFILTREHATFEGEHGFYTLHYRNRRYLTDFCRRGFERVTGIKLKPGERVEVELSMKIVRDSEMSIVLCKVCDIPVDSDENPEVFRDYFNGAPICDECYSNDMVWMGEVPE